MTGGILVGAFGLFILTMVVLSFVFWIWMIIDCAKNNRIAGGEKVAWLLVIIFLHFLGALIYFFAGRRK